MTSPETDKSSAPFPVAASGPSSSSWGSFTSSGNWGSKLWYKSTFVVDRDPRTQKTEPEDRSWGK